MAILIQLQNVYKRYGEQALLDGVNLQLDDQKKIGMIGRNGAGKSTLCQILLDEEPLDAGEVTRSKKLRLGYLRQHNPFQQGETVLDFLLRDSGHPDWRCGEVAAKFDIKGNILSGPVGELSGGWQTRVKLAALLLHDPNFLLLDEPTNFLDLRTQMFLEQFLRDFNAGCLIVSHDRAFLKATCSNTLDLSRGQLTLYPGNVDSYLSRQVEQREHDERVNATILAKRRQLQTFVDKNRGSPKTSSQARSKAKQLERLKTKELAGPETQIRIHVPAVEPRKGTAVRCVDLTIGYPDLTVASNVNVDVDHGSRVAVVGDNGQGKTTFLRTLCKSLDPIAGDVSWGHGCDVGVYAQHVYGSLPQNWTVLEYLTHCAVFDTSTQTVLNVAGSFLFRGDAIEKRIKILSGGERARLVLAGLLLGRHNVVIMDEPVNHLDVESVEALADALCQYRGTIIFTSHDRHFMNRVATSVVEVGNGRVANYPGDYDTYVYRVGREVAQHLREPDSGRLSKSVGGDRPSSSQSPQTGRERNLLQRQLKKELNSLERKIARWDEEKRTVRDLLMSTTETDEAEKLHTRQTELIGVLEPAELRWLELNEQLEAT